MSDGSAYLLAAQDFRRNEGQQQAYDSTGHCVILAGPGSGKTKTLTVKLARVLAEDVREPRGVACITYNNECARELETRLNALGVVPGRRLFVGTVHSFSLTQVILPYARAAGLPLPERFSVANDRQRRGALERAFARTVGGGGDPHRWRFRMDGYRRKYLDREADDWLASDLQLARLVEAYEAELRAAGLIDFEDMPLLAMRALRENAWIRKALLAKYPVLAVDEYQDLGRALHRMVLGLCFGTDAGMRLIAVGDVDQSIYGFNGAHPELLQALSERQDVEAVRLNLNYRSGTRIVRASGYALGEDRGYRATEGAADGAVYFHPVAGGMTGQARFLFNELLPAVRNRNPGLRLGEIAILYAAAWVGDEVAEAAGDVGLPVVRSDGNALYPRSSRLIAWLEVCAAWCVDGWRTGDPRFSVLAAAGERLLAEMLVSADDRRRFRLGLLGALWARRNARMSLNSWLRGMRDDLLASLLSGCRLARDEATLIDILIERTDAGAAGCEMTLGAFSGRGEGNDRINLSTLHSAKGREFDVVVLFGMDGGLIPHTLAPPAEAIDARRLFYVGLTRARREVHMLYAASQPSPFVNEVRTRLGA